MNIILMALYSTVSDNEIEIELKVSVELYYNTRIYVGVWSSHTKLWNLQYNNWDNNEKNLFPTAILTTNYWDDWRVFFYIVAIFVPIKK